MTSASLGIPPISPSDLNQQQFSQISNNQPQFVDTLKQTLQQAQQIQNDADQKVAA
jgi:flagellar hook-basal body complex protein FliE